MLRWHDVKGPLDYYKPYGNNSCMCKTTGKHVKVALWTGQIEQLKFPLGKTNLEMCICIQTNIVNIREEEGKGLMNTCNLSF